MRASASKIYLGTHVVWRVGSGHGGGALQRRRGMRRNEQRRTTDDELAVAASCSVSACENAFPFQATPRLRVRSLHHSTASARCHTRQIKLSLDVHTLWKKAHARDPAAIDANPVAYRRCRSSVGERIHCDRRRWQRTILLSMSPAAHLLNSTFQLVDGT